MRPMLSLFLLVACGTPELAVSIPFAATVDGAPFAFTPRGDDDRAFYDFVLDEAFANGNHELKFEEEVL